MRKKLFDARLQRRPRRHHIVHHDERALGHRAELDIAAEVPAAGGFVEGGLVGGGVEKRKDIMRWPPAGMAHGGDRITSACAGGAGACGRGDEVSARNDVAACLQMVKRSGENSADVPADGEVLFLLHGQDDTAMGRVVGAEGEDRHVHSEVRGVLKRRRGQALLARGTQQVTRRGASRAGARKEELAEVVCKTCHEPDS